MSNLEIKAAEMIVTPKKEGRKAFLDTFIFEPENIEEQNLGSLYIIGEITDISLNSEYLINLLVATIKKEYYSNTSRAPIESLEASLAKTNEMLSDFAEQGNIEWIGNLHITVAVFKNNILYFSQTGASKTLLVRGKNIVNIGEDLVSDLKPHPLKTFSNIASGQIDPGDRLILATSEFAENIGEKQIKSVIGANPGNVTEEFESLMDKKSSVALIFLEVKKKTAYGADADESKDAVDLGNIGEYSLQNAGKEDRLNEVINELNLAEKEVPISQKIKIVAKAARFIIRNAKKIVLAVAGFAKRIAIFAYSALKPRIISLFSRAAFETKRIIAKIFPARADEAATRQSALLAFGGNLRSVALKGAEILPLIKNLPVKKIAIAGGAAILVLAIALNLAAMAKKKQEAKNIEYYASILESAKKSEQEAEVAQMYEDEAKARELIKISLTNAEKLIKAGYFAEEAGLLLEKTVKEMEKLESLTRINEPVKIVDFAGNSQNIKTDGIVWIGKKLYSFNSENNAIYKYDFAKKTSEIVAVNSRDIGHLKIAKPMGSKIIFLTDSPGVAVYDPLKPELKNVPIKFIEAENDIADIGIFKSNLYILAKSDNEIYKHLLTAGGYERGQKWMKEEGENLIRNPVSLSIDTDIYVLEENNGDNFVSKFSRGLKKEFSLPQLLVPLRKASKIATDAGMKNIYLLDPENKRAVIVTKEGKIFKQFASDKFDNLIDLAVSPDEKQLYLLNRTSVYEIGL